MIENLIKYLVKNDLKDVVITVKNNISRVVEYHNSILEKNELSNITSYIITSKINKKQVTVSFEDISNKRKVLEILRKNALIDVEHFSDNHLCNIIDNHKYSLSEIDYNAFNKHVVTYLDKYPDLTDINASYGEDIDNIDIYNDLNEHVHDTNKYAYACFEVFAKCDGVNSSSYLVLFNKRNDEVLELLEEKIKDVIMLLDVKDIENGKYRAIFTNNVVANILEAFIPVFNADKHYYKISLLTDKLNQMIANEKVTIVEDPNNSLYIGKRLFDNEGTETTYKKIIDKGQYKVILYDKKYAALCKTTSTGNSYNGINVRSLYLMPGEEHLDMMNLLNDGVLINEIEGMHAGINITSGEVSLQASGYIIKKGIIVGASKLFIINFNFLDFLNNIEYINADLEFISSRCGAPSVIVKGINVSS